MSLTNCQGFLFSAGLGTRLKPFTNSAPKALYPLNGKALLQRNIEYLKSYGISSIIINTHHFANQIETFIKDNNEFNIDIQLSYEEELVETGGGIKKALNLIQSKDIVVLNSDILTDLKINTLYNFHKKSNASATLAVTDRESSRKLIFKNNKLTGWKNHKTGEIIGSSNGKEFAFSGMQILKKSFIENWEQEGKFSIIEPYLDYMNSHDIFCFNHSGDKVIDVGKTNALAIAEKLFP